VSIDLVSLKYLGQQRVTFQNLKASGPTAYLLLMPDQEQLARSRALDDLRRISEQIRVRTEERDALLARLHAEGYSIPKLAQASGMSVGKAHAVSKRALRKVSTIGYEGRSIENFVEEVETAGIECVVDVRELPLSRRRGFSKTALSERLALAGIRYEHERSLGNPKDNRDDFRAGNQRAITRYESLLAGSAADAIERLRRSIDASNIALLCYERDHSTCHRSCITRHMQSVDPNLVVERL
jgi:hypothetical protein